MFIVGMEDIAQLVRQRRRSLNLTQTQLAKNIGASREWVIRLEKGYPGLEAGLVFAALKALDLKLSIHIRDTHNASLGY